MFHVKVLFYLTQVRWPLVCNVILQLWSCPLIFNILLWPQVSISYLFSHIIHINIKGKSPEKLPSALKAVSQIIVSCSHSEATFDRYSQYSYLRVFHIAANKSAEERKQTALSWNEFYINKGKVWCCYCALKMIWVLKVYTAIKFYFSLFLLPLFWCVYNFQMHCVSLCHTDSLGFHIGVYILVILVIWYLFMSQYVLLYWIKY